MKPTAPKRIEDYRTTKERRENMIGMIVFCWIIMASLIFTSFKIGLFK